MVDHDQNFKNLILDYPQQALRFFANKEIDDDLSDARIIPLREEQLKESLGDRYRRLDVPLLVEWPDGRRLGLLFVLEEETEIRRFSIYRLAHYCLDLAELMKTERIVPVVVFLRSGRKQPELLQLGSDKQTYLEFRYLSCYLYQLSANDYCESENIVVRLNLPNMRYAPEARLKIYAAAQRGLASLESNPNLQSKYSDYIDLYADLTEEELNEYRDHYLDEGGIMGLSQILRQEGRQEECAALVTRQLRRKLGIHSALEEILKQLETLPLETLENLADALLDFNNVMDVRLWFDKLKLSE